MLHKLLFWFVQTLWIERTTMETSSRFPGVLSFYPVAKTEAVSVGSKGGGGGSVRGEGEVVRVGMGEVMEGECEGWWWWVG